VLTEVDKYTALRPLRCNGRDYGVGEVIEEAGSWTRIESWVRAGRVAHVRVLTVTPNADGARTPTPARTG